MQLSPPIGVFSSSNSVCCVNVHSQNTYMCTCLFGTYHSSLLLSRAEHVSKHLITSINNSSHLNVVRNNFISPWECFLFLDNHLWMVVKLGLKQYRQPNNSHREQPGREVPCNPPPRPQRTHCQCLGYHGQKRVLLYCRNRNKYCTQLGYMHTLHMYSISRFSEQNLCFLQNRLCQHAHSAFMPATNKANSVQQLTADHGVPD